TGASRAPKPALADTATGWLPGVEVNGEGVFLVLKHDALDSWEANDGVRRRVRAIDDNFRAKVERHGATPTRSITPRLVLIHTLAHLLIDQWDLDSGYPASSLRERLYVDDDMAGFLIYTATSDSAGSLGGVVAEAEARRLETAFRELLVRASWCSADPLCTE